MNVPKPRWRTSALWTPKPSIKDRTGDNMSRVSITDKQPFISVRWVVTEKIKEKGQITKAQLIAKSFVEEQEIAIDLFTCFKDSLRLVIFLVSTFGWKCNSLDISAGNCTDIN